MQTRRGPSSLQAKLLAFIIPSSVGALVLISIVGYWQLRRQAMDDLTRNVNNLAIQAAKEADAALVQSRNDLNTLTENPLFADYHNNLEYRLHQEADIYRSAVAGYIGAFAQRSRVYPDISYADVISGEVIHIVDGKEVPGRGRLILRDSLIQGGMKSGPASAAPEIRQGPAGERLLYFARPVFDQTSSVIGVLVLGYSLEAMRQRLASVMTWVNGNVLLEDHEGRQVIGIAAPYSHAIRAAAPLNGGLWNALVEIDGEFYLNPIRRVINWWLVLGAVMCVLIVFWVYGAVHTVTDPIRDLVAATKELAQGNWDFRVRVAQPVELEALATAFNEMASQIKAREEQQKRLQDYLIRSEKLSVVGQLITGIAHELNNPLTGVIGYSELLLDGDCPDIIKKDLNQIRAHALRCDRIVDNLLLFVRQGTHEKKQVDVNKVIHSVLVLLEYRMAKTQKIQVVFEAGRVGPVQGDFGQLEQVMINLIQNACDAVHAVAGKRRISVKTRAAHHQVEISVIDNGEGMAADHLEKIFEPFFTTKAPGKGTGLGLAIVKQIVEDHGGIIECHSRPGEGTAFVIKLPVLLAGEKIPALPAAPVARGKLKRSILVVDDERDVARMIVRQLGKYGHRGEAAFSADQALLKIGRKNYDFILLDLEMPHKGGQDLHRHLVETEPSVAAKLIFMTGNVLSPEALEFLERDQKSFLLKPFDGSDLAKIIDEA